MKRSKSHTPITRSLFVPTFLFPPYFFLVLGVPVFSTLLYLSIFQIMTSSLRSLFLLIPQRSINIFLFNLSAHPFFFTNFFVFYVLSTLIMLRMRSHTLNDIFKPDHFFVAHYYITCPVNFLSSVL